MTASILGGAAPAPAIKALRICADPNNLPFTNDRLEGFDNRIVDLIAAELHAHATYTWSPLRRGFLRRTLHADACDVVMGVATPVAGLALTEPYYTTSYVFVQGASNDLPLDDLDAEGLRKARIGLHAVNVEGSNPPPVSSLVARGLQDRIVGFIPWGRTGEESPQARIIDAVAAGEVDVAVVWGPVSGYFSKRYPRRLAVKALVSDARLPELSFTQSISIGVRADDADLRDAIQGVLTRRQREIHSILAEFDVPLTDEASSRSPSPVARASR